MNKQPILVLEDVAAGYRSPRQTVTVVQPVREVLHAGELVCLIGPNGAGKSTLLRTIAAMQPSLSGRVLLYGQDLHAMSVQARARALGVVLTQRVDVGLLTAWALVAMGRYPYTGWLGRLSAHDREVVAWALAQLDAQDLAARRFNTLSDGERQKVFIARALAQEPSVLILDEPTAFLDLPRRVESMQLLRRLAQHSGRTVLLSTHDLDLALRWADRIWLLPYGGILQTGMPEELVLNGGFEAAFASSGVQFDAYTGAFKTTAPATQQVVLEGEDSVARFWTRRALERERFDVATTRANNVPLVRVERGASPFWLVEMGGHARRCDSLPQLITTLRGLTVG